jgi:hypothetical protein
MGVKKPALGHGREFPLRPSPRYDGLRRNRDQ